MVALIARSIAKYPKHLFIRLDNTQSEISRPPWKKSLEKCLIKFFYPKADAIVGVSKAVLEDFKSYSGIKHSKLITIYNPIIKQEIYKKASAPLVHQWFNPKTMSVIVAIGRLTEQKNFSLLIKSFAKLVENYKANLVILGEGPLRPDIETLINRLNVQELVSLPGVVANPYNYLKNADLFVLSSNYEGLPTVLVEALACGCPVVSTDCPSGPKEILDNGKYGVLVQTGNIDQLAAAMMQTLSSKPITVPSTWLDQFTEEVIVNEYLDLMGLSHSFQS